MKQKLLLLFMMMVGTMGMQAKLKMVTWDAKFIQNIKCITNNSITVNENNSKDGITVRFSGGDNDQGWKSDKIIIGNGSSLTFTSSIGKFKSIQIYCGVRYSNGLSFINWHDEGTEDNGFVGWSSTPNEIVSLLPQLLMVHDITEVVFTIELPDSYEAGDQFAVDGLMYEVQEGKTDVWLIGYEGEKPTGDLVIPSTVEGYNVTGIGYRAFFDCGDLTLVSIPNGVKTVSDYAFCNCSKLKAVTIGSGVRYIYRDAFYNCNRVTDVYCYANPSSLYWHDATSEDPDDFKKSTKFHVANASAWSSEFPNAHVTFVGDLNSPTLTDGEAYTRTIDQEVNTVTFVKTLGSDRIGKYQAWMVPFDYTITSADASKFDFYRIHMIADSPTPWDGTDYGVMWIFLKKMEVGDCLRGNMPYVYKPKEAVSDYKFTSRNVILYGKNAEAQLKTETTTAVFSFYGTFSNTTATGSNPFFYVNDEGGISFSEDMTVEPYHWIIRDADKWEEETENWPYTKEMVFVAGEEDITGISSLLTSPEEEKQIYDLSGRRVEFKIQNSRLPRGINIIRYSDGTTKKMLIK